MPTTAASRLTDLGAPTGNRKWWYDVNTAAAGAPEVWVPIMGISDNTFSPDKAHMEDSSDNDGGGYESSAKTGAGWSAEITVNRKTLRTSVTAYDPGQEFLRGKAIGKFGVQNTADIRVYEMEPGGPRVEAYRGNVAVAYEPTGGNMEALSSVKITMTGQGLLSSIAHPDTTVAAAPAVTVVSPASGPAAGGQVVTLVGSGFTGATAVTIGGTAVTSFVVQSDGSLVLSTPAKAASTGNVVRVTTAAGQSSAAGPTYTYV